MLGMTAATMWRFESAARPDSVASSSQDLAYAMGLAQFNSDRLVSEKNRPVGGPNGSSLGRVSTGDGDRRATLATDSRMCEHPKKGGLNAQYGLPLPRLPDLQWSRRNDHA
jgi:hypothetical protein